MTTPIHCNLCPITIYPSEIYVYIYIYCLILEHFLYFDRGLQTHETRNGQTRRKVSIKINYSARKKGK